ncbi:KHG/KDPG aldolase isoform X2 [Capsicum annuum]|uniref:KHG/KDPG aldolase isoform X2 n=1 Tax=Capsicum annuum TaxID=4072 RepID=UPI001FB0DA1A|nr:KHG/KDPG aldolase isoform X2 [Capsicum annuum]
MAIATSFSLPLTYPSSSLTTHIQKPCRCSSSSNSISVASKTLQQIQDSGVIACLRAQNADLANRAARAALDGGISVLEIVVTTPDAFEVLRNLVHDYPTKTFGVGTVLQAKDAKDSIKAGAKFLMSPATVMDILVGVSESDVLYIPGVMTPTEILSAFSAGAKIVKVYPVSALGGVGYISALKKPFSHIPMVASQGVTIGAYVGSGRNNAIWPVPLALVPQFLHQTSKP